VRWLRLAGHAASAALILAFVFPHAAPSTRRRLVRWWSGKLVRIVGLRVRVSGPLPRAHGEAAMIAANHVSWVDTFVVMSVRPARFVAKSEIRDWPVAGWIAQRAGTLFVKRERRRDIAQILGPVHEALAQGDCIGLFPEGTTTEGDRLLRFHSSLFEPAIANAATIHPAAIRYERADGSPCPALAYVGEISFMESVGLAIGERGVVARLAFGEPIEPHARLDRRGAARAAHERIASLLAIDSAGSPPGRAPDRRGEPP
jgi:1-acyl-sn-glycerol-3-phosphate acyltransferase